MSARRLLGGFLVAAVFAAAPSAAHAGGGHFVFAGGTRAERDVVVQALNASAFDWDLVPDTITIHIVPGVDSQAYRGNIRLDANLLDAGMFAWGVVQHEYAHQVDFDLLDDAKRARLLQLLGGSAWCDQTLALPHDEYGCERFASTLAWSYWPSPENCMRPESATDESAAMPPARFRAVLASIFDETAGTTGDPGGRSP